MKNKRKGETVNVKRSERNEKKEKVLGGRLCSSFH